MLFFLIKHNYNIYVFVFISMAFHIYRVNILLQVIKT